MFPTNVFLRCFQTEVAYKQLAQDCNRNSPENRSRDGTSELGVAWGSCGAKAPCCRAPVPPRTSRVNSAFESIPKKFHSVELRKKCIATASGRRGNPSGALGFQYTTKWSQFADSSSFGPGSLSRTAHRAVVIGTDFALGLCVHHRKVRMLSLQTLTRSATPRAKKNRHAPRRREAPPHCASLTVQN